MSGDANDSPTPTCPAPPARDLMTAHLFILRLCEQRLAPLHAASGRVRAARARGTDYKYVRQIKGAVPAAT